jgi:hypothetical protein
MQAGADEAKVREIPTWRESRRFSDAERVALEYAEAMTITGQRVSDELFARLKGYYDEAQIVELTAAVALENFRSKMNVPLQVQAQGFCVIPERQNAEDGGSPRPESATQAQPRAGSSESVEERDQGGPPHG